MKGQITAPPAPKEEFGMAAIPPAGATAVEEQTELSPAPERSTPRKGREIHPLPLVLTILALALLLLIPSLLLLHRLES